MKGYDDIPKEIPDLDAKKVADWASHPHFFFFEKNRKALCRRGIVLLVYSNLRFFTMMQPEDWNDEKNGEWKAPMKTNPEYKGPWKQKVYVPF